MIDACGSSRASYARLPFTTVHLFSHAFVDTHLRVLANALDSQLQTVATVSLAPGAYFVVIDGFGTSSGDYVVTTTCAFPPPPPPTTAPPTTASGPIQGFVTCGQIATGDTTTGGASNVGQSSPEHWQVVLNCLAMRTAIDVWRELTLDATHVHIHQAL
jgi:hypothetical protein